MNALPLKSGHPASAPAGACHRHGGGPSSASLSGLLHAVRDFSRTSTLRAPSPDWQGRLTATLAHPIPSF